MASEPETQTDVEEVHRCLDFECENILSDKMHIFCDECLSGERAEEKRCVSCKEVTPDGSRLCSDCSERLRKSFREAGLGCIRCETEITDGSLFTCEDCRNSKMREYRCQSCGSIFEASRANDPSCDSCGDAGEDDSTVQEYNPGEETIATPTQTTLSPQPTKQKEEEKEEEVEKTWPERKIYVMHTQEYTKIGISKSPEKRKRAIQSHTPRLVELAGIINSDRPGEAERALHNALDEFQTPTEREWFELPADICERLEETDSLTVEEIQSRFGR